MSSNARILHGDLLEKNLPPTQNGSSSYLVRLKGKFRSSSASFDIDESILSKHSLFIGGTGCGKTTLFFHFVEQFK